MDSYGKKDGGEPPGMLSKTDRKYKTENIDS